MLYPLPPLEMEWMEAAFAQASAALLEEEVPVGCVLVKGGRVITQGRNRVNETKNATRHAELVALEALQGSIRERCCNAGRDRAHKCATCQAVFSGLVQGSTLYVTVEPCIMCATALRLCGIRAAVFGCCNDRFGGAGSVLSLHSDYSVLPGYEVTARVQAERAMQLLVQFYKLENKSAPQDKRKIK